MIILIRSLPTKMSPPPSLSQTTLFSRPAAHPLKIRKQNCLSKFKKRHNHTNAYTKSKQKKQFQDLHSQKPKATPSKRQSKTIHKTPLTRKYTHPDSHPNPPRIRTNPSQNPYTPKYKYVFPQTQVHFTPNAEEFAPKRKGVSPKTQGRLTTNASPFSAPKSPDNSPFYLPQTPQNPLKQEGPASRFPQTFPFRASTTPSRSLLKGVFSPNSLENPYKNRIRKTPKFR